MRTVGIDVHEYRKAIADDCVIGVCTVNNCMYPNCAPSGMVLAGLIIDDFDSRMLYGVEGESIKGIINE